MKCKNLPVIDLSLFDGAAAGGEGAGTAAPAQADAGAPGETQTVPAAAGREEKPEAPKDSGTLEDRRREFMDLVSGSGEYRDVFHEQVQRIIDRRFRQTKELEQREARRQPIIDALMQRYRILDGDTDKLMAAIENDDLYWTQAAREAGMGVEQYKQFQRLQRENAAFRKMERQMRSQEAVQRQLGQWQSEAQQVKELYPDFDLGRETQDPQFLSLLRSGIPVRHAYEVIHMEDIKALSARQAAQQAQRQVVEGIRAKGARPAENGTSSQSAFTVKDDVTKLTAKDRAEIARRAARGEPISF